MWSQEDPDPYDAAQISQVWKLLLRHHAWCLLSGNFKIRLRPCIHSSVVMSLPAQKEN